MTFEKLKQNLIEEKSVMSNKDLKKLVIKVALAILGITLTLGLATYNILGFGFTVIAILLMLALFNSIFTVIIENETSLKGVKRFGSLWWIFYISLVLMFFALKFFNFM